MTADIILLVLYLGAIAGLLLIGGAIAWIIEAIMEEWT